jgi:NH3-dependent NAD+ synthetase
MIPGITDELAFEIPYDNLDKILYALENDLTMEGKLKAKESYVQTLIEQSAHMRKIEMPLFSDSQSK